MRVRRIPSRRTFTLQLYDVPEVPPTPEHKPGDVELRQVQAGPRLRWQWFDPSSGHAIRGVYLTESSAWANRDLARSQVRDWMAKEAQRLEQRLQTAKARTELGI